MNYLVSSIYFVYAALFSHRHPLSHFPIIGTAFRVAYLLFWGWAISYSFGREVQYITLIRDNIARIAFAVTGLAFCDLVHWCMDGFPVPGKVYKKKK